MIDLGGRQLDWVSPLIFGAGYGIFSEYADDVHQYRVEGDESAVQAIIDGYTLADAIGHCKSIVDCIEQDKLRESIQLFYPGVVLDQLETDSWRPKFAEATVWQAWSDGGKVGEEPATPVIDLEVSEVVVKSELVAKIIAKGSALNAQWRAIKTNAQTIKAAISAAESAGFDAIAAVDINAGWPV